MFLCPSYLLSMCLLSIICYDTPQNCLFFRIFLYRLVAHYGTGLDPVTCNMYHVTCKLCNHYSDVVISSNATERHVESIMKFHVSGWIDIVHYII